MGQPSRLVKLMVWSALPDKGLLYKYGSPKSMYPKCGPNYKPVSTLQYVSFEPHSAVFGVHKILSLVSKKVNAIHVLNSAIILESFSNNFGKS